MKANLDHLKNLGIQNWNRLRDSWTRIQEGVERRSIRGGVALVFRVLVTLYHFVQITVREFIADRLFLRANALTFASLLAVIPLLAIMFSLFQLFGGGEWFIKVLEPFLMRTLAPGSGPVVAKRIGDLLQNVGGRTVGGLGVLFLVLAVYGIFTAIESTFNLIWRGTSRAGALRRLPLYWGLVTIIPILVVSSLALTTYLRTIPLAHHMAAHVSAAESIINRLLPGAMATISFFLLYRFLPSTRVRTYSAATGAIIAGLLYEGIKSFFIVYTGKLIQYDVIYGSLAIIPILMVWVNLSWIVVLGGVEVCFVVQHYSLLLHESKRIEFSRPQQDALAYMILAALTEAFRNRRDPVTIEEWTHKYGIPPGIILSVVEKLSAGGILKRTEPNHDEIVLSRDPDTIEVRTIDRILSGEVREEWNWPPEHYWQWFKMWYDQRNSSALPNTGDLKLSSLIAELESYKLRAEKGK